MRHLLPLLCVAAALAPRALAEPIDDFALYTYAQPVDDQPGWHDGIIPPGYATLTTFSLPATPTGPLPLFYPIPGEPPFVSGFEIDNVPGLVNGVPTTLPFVQFLAEYEGGGFLLDGSIGGHSGVLYTLSGDNVPTFTPIPTDVGGALLFQSAVPVAILTITPEPDTSPVPEPATLTLLATGAVGLLTTRIRRR